MLKRFISSGKVIMIKLAEIILEVLKSDSGLNTFLASYNEQPAVFFRQAPPDSDPGWGISKFPRIVFRLDPKQQNDPLNVGSVVIHISCKEQELSPLMIEPAVQECFKDLFLHPDDSAVCCLRYQRLDGFTEDGRDRSSFVMENSCDLLFDILEFSDQEAFDPDPVAAVNQYLAETFRLADINHAGTGSSYRAAAPIPAFYCRLVQSAVNRDTNTVVWMDADIAVHLITPDRSDRVKWTSHIVNTCSLKGEIEMADGSPMFLGMVKADHNADMYLIGQITLSVQFGILKPLAKGATIQKAYWELK